MMTVIEAPLNVSEVHIAIVVARINKFINNRLLEGAIDTLIRIGSVNSKKITVVWVPGAYEIPLIVKNLAFSKKFKAIIAIGTIIQGNTSHFEYIAASVINSLMGISQAYSIPVTLGILTTNDINQAIERAGNKLGNKGAEAAIAALEMINIIKKCHK